MASMERPDVLVVTIAPGLRCFAASASTLRLMSRSSLTTSMIQSASAMRPQSSSKLPTSIFPASFPVKKGAGFDFNARRRASLPKRLRTAGLSSVRPLAVSWAVGSGGTMSSMTEGMPALARWAAIALPITPLPRMAAFSIFGAMSVLVKNE